MMSRAHKIVNLIGVPLPLVGVIVAIVLLWNEAVGPLELGLLIGLYVWMFRRAATVETRAPNGTRRATSSPRPNARGTSTSAKYSRR